MVIGASNYWRSWTGQADSTDEIIPIGAGPQDTVIEPPQLMNTLYPLGTGAAPVPSDILVRRDIVQAVSGFEASFRGPLMLYEDQAFLSKVYRSHPVYVASACWDRYRLRADSIVATTNAAGRYWQVRGHFLRWLRHDLDRTGGPPPAVRDALGRAIRQARMQMARAWLASAVRRVVPAPLYERLRPRRAAP